MDNRELRRSARHDPPNADTLSHVLQVLAYLEAHWRTQPTLDELAGAAGLSPCHLQRVFRYWAGVSPKRVLQFLTVEHAKGRLRAASSVLETALDAGLSGPSRLHDLFLAAEAMAPGAYRRGGAGIRIRYGVHASPFGRVLIACTALGVCRLEFVAGDHTGIDELRASHPDAELVADPDATAEVAARLNRRGFRGEPLALAPRGTNFELKVWQALLRLPMGALASYGDIAKFVGRPRASRAVGRAVGANPVALLIPCHRVIRASGTLGQYAGGPLRKKAIIAWEAARVWGPDERGDADARQR